MVPPTLLHSPARFSTYRPFAVKPKSCLSTRNGSLINICKGVGFSSSRGTLLQAAPLTSAGHMFRTRTWRKIETDVANSSGRDVSLRSTAHESLTSIDANEAPVTVTIEIDEEEDCTVITIEAQDQSYLLMRLSGAFQAAGLEVMSASITSEGGRVMDVFRVRGSDGHNVPEKSFPQIRQIIMSMLNSSSRSNKPAIYGIVAAAEVERLRPVNQGEAGRSEVLSLEFAAAEMAQAAADLVAQERSILDMEESGGTAEELETARAEAAARLERKMSAMEAVLSARRTIKDKTFEDQRADDNKAAMMELMKPPSMQTGTGAGCGTGYEILFQGFSWESHKHGLYKKLKGMVEDLASAGFTAVWLPPPSESVCPQGYLPLDLYKLDCAYGTEAELRDLISEMHKHGLKAIADIVINHRCANHQGADGKWNKFGGRLNWDHSYIVSNNPEFGGTGAQKTWGDDYTAAPNIDHTQDRVRNDLSEWMKHLRTSVGFDGWRLDYVRGYSGSFVKHYIDATSPEMVFGEYWDSCDYSDGVLNYNQDAHRQRTIDWCDATGGIAAAFDFTTKGILQEAVARREYWRLTDSQGRPPGVMGVWPSRAVTFLDNHDTGSTLNHWPFPESHLPEGYAYILLHPGTPTVFFDHLFDKTLGPLIREMLKVRKRNNLNCRSKVVIKKSTADTYAALIDGKVAMKIGFGDWSPNSAGIKYNGKQFKLCSSGHQFAVWDTVDS